VKDKLILRGAAEHNLKNIDVAFPLHMLTVVTGVSGSGKTTLVKRILYPALKRELEGFSERPGAYRSLEGDIHRMKAVELVDQNPIGRSSRSNPVTYVKAWDEIRQLYSDVDISKMRGYRPASSASTWTAVVAMFAKAKARSTSKCSSWRTSVLPAKPATANGSRRRSWM
jgi:excinuclease ABC subunit A